MKSIRGLVLLVALAASEPAHRFSHKQVLPIEYCTSGTSDYLSNVFMEIVPHPVIVAEGRSLTVTSSFELTHAIEAGSTLKLNIVKKGLINIPIPCMEVGAALPMGSCTYELDQIVEASKLCPTFCPEGQTNSLPYQPGKYGGNSVESVIGHISDLVLPFINGKVEITGHIKNAAGHETICFKTIIELKKA